MACPNHCPKKDMNSFKNCAQIFSMGMSISAVMFNSYKHLKTIYSCHFSSCPGAHLVFITS